MSELYQIKCDSDAEKSREGKKEQLGREGQRENKFGPVFLMGWVLAQSSDCLENDSIFFVFYFI